VTGAAAASAVAYLTTAAVLLASFRSVTRANSRAAEAEVPVPDEAEVSR
jgi:hypothetical protein